MPLCQISRVDRARGRDYSCVMEHKLLQNEYIGCGFLNRSSFMMPDNLKKYIPTRGKAKKREEQHEKEEEVQRQVKRASKCVWW